MGYSFWTSVQRYIYRSLFCRLGIHLGTKGGGSGVCWDCCRKVK